MNETKHTPGPWEAQERKWGYPDYDGGPINPLWQIWADNRPLAGTTIYDTPEENVANARLIAAAPELLEALEAAMSYIELSPCDPDIHTDQWRAWERLQVADPKAVIAKARGEVRG